MNLKSITIIIIASLVIFTVVFTIYYFYSFSAKNSSVSNTTGSEVPVSDVPLKNQNSNTQSNIISDADTTLDISNYLKNIPDDSFLNSYINSLDDTLKYF